MKFFVSIHTKEVELYLEERRNGHFANRTFGVIGLVALHALAAELVAAWQDAGLTKIIIA